MTNRLYLEKFGPIHALPVLHYRMEFAHLVRTAFSNLSPDAVAVELPQTLEIPFIRALRRLPQISVISYQSKIDKESELKTVYLLVEPADPFVELSRLALEKKIPLHFIDVDTDLYPSYKEHFPDSYSITRIGLESYYREYCSINSENSSREDLMRERGMAYRLQNMARHYERVLFVCGMAHLKQIKDFFDVIQAEPLEHIQRKDVKILNLHPASCREILGEIPFLSAIYELLRGPLPKLKMDENGTEMRNRFRSLKLINGGKQNISEEKLLNNAILRTAHFLENDGALIDRQRLIYLLFNEVANHYRQETGELLSIWQKIAFFRFARNYALLVGMLLPDLYQLLVAARGCIDNNFAYFFCRLATFYPWQSECSDLETISISPEEIWGGSRTIRFRPRQKQIKGLTKIGLLNRKREKHSGEWLESFDNSMICSYPPEDVAIEEYGRFLKHKGCHQISDEMKRTEKFNSSFLDGIDMRETLRNINEGSIYVREDQRVIGGVGCLVVIFDDNRHNDHYPFCMTWIGEHEQESDMAFYATDPADKIVGPGISRCEYGGFMLSYPPRRMIDVWKDPDYCLSTSKSDLLLMAALDYSIEKHIVYTAARPPNSIFKQMADRRDRKIVYIPLGSLSPQKIRKMRILHILSGRDKRSIAKDYIW